MSRFSQTLTLWNHFACLLYIVVLLYWYVWDKMLIKTFENIFKMKVLVLTRVENTVANWGITHNEQLNLSPQCFQESTAADTSKSKCVCMLEEVNCFKNESVIWNVMKLKHGKPFFSEPCPPLICPDLDIPEGCTPKKRYTVGPDGITRCPACYDVQDCRKYVY